MSRLFLSSRQGDMTPAREQNLFITVSKHYYCLADGTLKFQKKEIDSRHPGNRRLLTRFVLLDTDTRTIYGEIHDNTTNKDLLGFLARAWSEKRLHPMKGLPSTLNVSQLVRMDRDFSKALAFLQNLAGIQIGDLPGGFSAGIYAVKEYENAIQSLFWNGTKYEAPDLFMAQACSVVVSMEASGDAVFRWEEQWKKVPAPEKAFFSAVDSFYTPIGAWRHEPFDLFLSPKAKRPDHG